MTILIGRDHPAAALRSAVQRTVHSHGGLALVTGEAGIGKSTLVTDIAAAFRGELTVAFATSWESEAVPDHWLWVQVLRSLRAQLGDETWQELHPAPPVAALLGLGDGSAPAQFELYDAVTQILISASQRGPVLVVLDDLHFADPGSLELLKFASQHTWFERVLFVATYRDSEIDPGHRLRARMLPLVAKATMISLEGLDEHGVAELCRTTVGDAPDADTVAEITRRTGGNPFFVEQTAQLWASGQRVDATTAGMRDALQRRIDQLPEPLVRMLTLASVGGREFHAGVMSQASGLDLHRIESALDAACQTRLVRRESDRYVFVHDLVRETLYNTMTSDEAAHHHGCIVRALVADESLQKLMLSTEIAHHAWLAGDDLDPVIAVEFLERAATESRGCLSAPGAEKYFRRALERCTPAMVRRRILLRLELAGTVKWLQREEESWKLYDQAVLEARDSGDPMLLARAAIELPQNERVDALCRLKADAYEALAGKRPDPALDHDGLTRQLNYEFLMAARQTGDDEEVAFGLWATHSVDWGPGTAAARQVIVEELDEITRRTGDVDMRLFAASLRWVAMLEQGDPAFRSQVDLFCALAENSDSERWHSGADIDHAVIDIVQGRWDSAAERIDKAYAVAGDDPMNDHMMRHLRWELAFARGEAPEPAPDSWRTHFGVWHSDLLTGLSAVRRGDLDEAHRVKARLDGEADPHDAWVSLRLRFEVELAAAEGDTEAIAALRERLEPHEGEWLVALWGSSVHGPISHWLGVLAAASGDHARATAHFAAAIEQAERLDAPPWAEAARSALAEIAAPAPEPERRTAAATGAVFRRDGSTWTLRYEGRGVHLPHTKGLADLHRLLQRPGVEVSAVDLLAVPLNDLEGGEAVTADARLGGDDLLDAEARARYRDHLETLDEQIDTAAALGDDARAARLDAERQALIEQLKAATGLGGRSRRLGDNAERARKSVTNRIRNTLKKIEAVHPALARHLSAAVATGSACVYRPETEAPHWEL
ncbi:ATP-binding protein [Glycomyces algeriensis]|uniref:ATP-binding protein n=1 Tax=Glycomyces algeriensis TaxID=256037 RepID=UPI0022D66E71|nr:AAA family ATPase [Glycomyces algeriensis]MDA1368784.1 AAA family ATPase [Glycomyces algeriensis]MDR7349404.1 tetratricopeptide (TPR) repeat protein [Glycomyces algeriensis]